MRRYDLLESFLGPVPAMSQAPEGTRDKINAAYAERLSWSLEKPRGYICSPLGAPDQAGIVQNMMAARIYSEVASRNMNLVGRAPHAWLPEFLDDNNAAERQIGLEVGASMLRSADCCIVCGNKISPGMLSEIDLAARENITVYTFSDKARTAVDEILAATTNGIRKHTHIEPPVTSDLQVLAMTPEEVNGLRLTGHDRRDVTLHDQLPKVTLDLFHSLSSGEISSLEDYADYRIQRDAGGDFIPTYERQMRSIEQKIMANCQSAGLAKPDSRQYLKAIVKDQEPSRTLAKTDTLTQPKGRGR